jgi:hypothetical protein
MEDDSSTSDWINHIGKANKKMTLRHKRLPIDKPSLAASEPRKLTVGEIQQSYSNGDAKHELPFQLKVMVGIGADWHSG